LEEIPAKFKAFLKNIKSVDKEAFVANKDGFNVTLQSTKYYKVIKFGDKTMGTLGIFDFLNTS